MVVTTIGPSHDASPPRCTKNYTKGWIWVSQTWLDLGQSNMANSWEICSNKLLEHTRRTTLGESSGWRYLRCRIHKHAPLLLLHKSQMSPATPTCINLHPLQAPTPMTSQMSAEMLAHAYLNRHPPVVMFL